MKLLELFTAGDDKENVTHQIPSLTKQLQLDELWIILSECLSELEKTPDHHAALILQVRYRSTYFMFGLKETVIGKSTRWNIKISLTGEMGRSMS